MSKPLRLFWLAYLALFGCILMLPAGSAVEGQLFPIWRGLNLDGRPVRGSRFIAFTLSGTKMRQAPSPGVDVTLTVPAVGDRPADSFDLTLYVDKSERGEPACTHRIPWSHGQAVDVGKHDLPFCVEVPENVLPSQPIGLRVVPRYRGLGGLWELRPPFPAMTDLLP